MKTVLIFGGNGFIGSEATKLLLKEDGIDITVVNRGKSWDWDTKNSIKPFVKCIKFDRGKDIRTSRELVDLAETKTFDFLIDFSGYKAEYVRDTTSLFAGKVEMYVYISTDSVYEVCEKKHKGFTTETDAKRPTDPEVKKRLKRRDSYGHKKLKCEEVLLGQEIPYVTLRLADVIGAFDSTDRWWQYQVWIEAAIKAQLPVYIREQLKGMQISVVYVKDVAQVIRNIVTGKTGHDIVQNQSFNLACLETCTVHDLVQKIARCSHGQNVQVEFSSDNDVPQMYPSVDLGPVDIAKAKKLLDFHPTPLDEACKEIVNAYSSVQHKKEFDSEKGSLLEDLKDDLEDLYAEDSFKHLLTQMKNVMHL